MSYGTLETCCPACHVDFEFDLDGPWDDFYCPRCDEWLTLEVDDWVQYNEDGDAVDDGIDFTVERSSALRPSPFQRFVTTTTPSETP